MKLTVYQIIQGTRPVLQFVDGKDREAVAAAEDIEARAAHIQDNGEQTIYTKFMSQAVGHDLEISKLRTPAFETSLRIVEQHDGSVVIRILGVEVKIDFQSEDAAAHQAKESH